MIDGSGRKKDLSRRMNRERHGEESKEESNYEQNDMAAEEG